MDKTISTIDEYIAQFTPEVQALLNTLRAAIKEAAPQAGEKISWGMATFVLHGNLVHFSAEKKHIGFHPAPSAIDAFWDELEGYRCSKGTVQLPYEKPLPLELIRKMVRYRVDEQSALAEAKKAKQALPLEEPKRRPRCPMPGDVKEALAAAGLTKRFEARPPYQRNDYISWITRAKREETKAKREETKAKRLNQMLRELRGGDAYMGMAYSAKKL